MEDNRKINYDDEPVCYCKNCLSLKIMRYNNPTPEQFLKDAGYCGMCTSTNIDTTHIYEWEKMFQLKYGYKYLNIKKKK